MAVTDHNTYTFKKTMAKKRTQPALTIRQIEEALWRSNGLITATAKKLNVTQSAISYRIKRSERLQKVLEDITEKLIDKSESVIFEHMQNKNLTAAIFHLKTKGKHRGYSEKQNIEVEGKLNLTHDDWIKKLDEQ